MSKITLKVGNGNGNSEHDIIINNKLIKQPNVFAKVAKLPNLDEINKEYVLEKDKELNQKLSPESFLIEYDIEHYNHLTELYNGFELRKKIYIRFNQIKSKNLDLLNKDISSSSSLRWYNSVL